MSFSIDAALLWKTTGLFPTTMFDHKLFKVYHFDQIPLNRDVYLMDEKWIAEWESGMVKMFNRGGYPIVGYISHAAVRAIGESALELSWYPNVHTRFHEMKIIMPLEQLIKCVGCYEYDHDPVLFVKGKWLSQIHLRRHSVFALVDAIGVKAALLAGSLDRKLLIRLRKRIDTVSKHHESFSFVSFADSLLLKSNWYVGQYNSKTKYSYEPELIIRALVDVRKVYKDVLGMEIYAVLTQGSNEYYDDNLLHISGNHVSLNSLGLPFAQLLEIDSAARDAKKKKLHEAADLYMDEDYFHSLNFIQEFAMKKNELPKYSYHLPMGTGPGYYYCSNFDDLRANLRKGYKRTK